MLKYLLSAMLFVSTSAAAVAAPTAVVLSKDNFVKLVGPVTDDSSSKFINDLLLQQGKREITVYIDSPGGSVIAGAQIVQTVRNLKASNSNLRIRCYAANAASMAFVVLQSICDQRLIGEVSALMQHQATFQVGGRTGEVTARVALITSYINWMDAIQAVRLGITIKELRARTVDEWWMLGDEAIKSKAADKIVPILCTPALVKSTHVETFQNLFFKAEITWSDCPLVNSPLEVKMDNPLNIPLVLRDLEARQRRLPE